MPTRILVILLLACTPITLRAQFIFQNLRWEDGLSAKEVRCLYKDNDGYLWIGTSNGLNRFDGAVIRQFKNTKHLNSLYINAIHPLAGDSLLIGCRLGVRVFNKRTGTFTTDNRFLALNNEIISCIKPDEYGRLWIATSTQVFVFANGKLYTSAEFMPNAIKMARQGYTIAAFAWDKMRKGFWVGGDITYFKK